MLVVSLPMPVVGLVAGVGWGGVKVGAWGRWNPSQMCSSYGMGWCAYAPCGRHGSGANQAGNVRIISAMSAPMEGSGEVWALVLSRWQYGGNRRPNVRRCR